MEQQVVLRRRGWLPTLVGPALWLTVWYSLQANWLWLIIQGNGHMIKGQPPAPTRPVDIAWWVAFTLIPLPFAVEFLWLLFGTERLAYGGCQLPVQRALFGIRLRVRTYAVDAIVRVVPEPEEPWWHLPNDLEPGSRGAVAIMKSGKRIRLAQLLSGRAHEVRELVQSLNSWLETATSGRA